jgi:hypothetical protein
MQDATKLVKKSRRQEKRIFCSQNELTFHRRLASWGNDIIGWKSGEHGAQILCFSVKSSQFIHAQKPAAPQKNL